MLYRLTTALRSSAPPILESQLTRLRLLHLALVSRWPHCVERRSRGRERRLQASVNHAIRSPSRREYHAVNTRQIAFHPPWSNPNPMTNVNLAARCGRCGHTFHSGIVIGPAVRSSVFANNSSTCPRCRAIAAIDDVAIDDRGNLHFIRRAYAILRDPQVDASGLIRFKDLLEQAREGVITREEATKGAIAINPTFRDLLVPKSAGDFWQLVGVIIAIILLLLQFRDDAPPEINQTIINNITQQISVVAPPTQPPKSAKRNAARSRQPLPSAVKKMPRKPGTAKGWKNSRCKCGTGKRFRDCCGRR